MAQPGGVRNSQPVWKVSTPSVKWEAVKCSKWTASSSGRNWMESAPIRPSHSASNPNGHSSSHPVVLAMVRGRQR